MDYDEPSVSSGSETDDAADEDDYHMTEEHYQVSPEVKRKRGRPPKERKERSMVAVPKHNIKGDLMDVAQINRMLMASEKQAGEDDEEILI